VLDKIKELRVMQNQRFDKGGKVQAIVKALKKAEEEASNEAERKGIIKKKGSMKIVSEGIVAIVGILVVHSICIISYVMPIYSLCGQIMMKYYVD
jgi:hypothetical protein